MAIIRLSFVDVRILLDGETILSHQISNIYVELSAMIVLILDNSTTNCCHEANRMAMNSDVLYKCGSYSTLKPWTCYAMEKDGVTGGWDNGTMGFYLPKAPALQLMQRARFATTNHLPSFTPCTSSRHKQQYAVSQTIKMPHTC